MATSHLAFTQSNALYFEKGSFALNSESSSTLDSIISILKVEENNQEIAIIGHTDSDASEDYNDELALERAHAVKDYLSKHEIHNRFHLLSKGEFSPVNDNLNEAQKRLNRRVDLVLNYQLNNYSTGAFEQESQIYKIGPYEPATIETKYGTKISFEKDIFESVQPQFSIKIHVKEYYDKASFVLANLTTETTDNKRLESKGMINVHAIQNGDTLKLKDGKSIDILFPDRRINDEMQLFEGTIHNQEISWDQTTFTSSRTFESTMWGITFYKGGDTISKFKSWYENIGDETFEITRTEDLRSKTVTIDTANVANEKLMSELITSSTNMGWINCDRFLKDNGPKVDLIVEFEGDFVPTVSIIFDDINAVLPYSYRENNQLIFANIPINRNITFVGLHKEKYSEEILFAMIKSKSQEGLKQQLRFEKKEASQIKSVLTKL